MSKPAVSRLIWGAGPHNGIRTTFWGLHVDGSAWMRDGEFFAQAQGATTLQLGNDEKRSPDALLAQALRLMAGELTAIADGLEEER